MGTLRFFEEVVSFKIRRTFGFADYTKIAFFLNFKEGNFSKKTCIKEKIDVFLLYKDCTISENVLRKIFRRCGKYDTTPNH